MLNLLKKVNQYAGRHELWQAEDGLVVGVSGGPDSRALLDVLAHLSAKYRFRLHVAHVNYRLRSEDSDRDEEFVRALAREYMIPITVKRVRISESTGNLEMRLREIRYRFFERIREKQGFQSVAVAHTQDDQAETVLLHVLRGTGMAGLKAMLPRTGTVIRPFLDTPRAEVLAYCRQKRLKFRVDRTNAELRFTRNRIRHRLLPYLVKYFNPSIRRTLARTATLVGEEYAFLGSEQERARSFQRKKNQSIQLSEAEFLALTPALRRKRLRNVLQDMGQALSFSQHEEILKMLCSPKRKTRSIQVGGLKISRKNGTIQVILL